jgi:hypothetical protein
MEKNQHSHEHGTNFIQLQTDVQQYLLNIVSNLLYTVERVNTVGRMAGRYNYCNPDSLWIAY